MSHYNHGPYCGCSLSGSDSYTFSRIECHTWAVRRIQDNSDINFVRRSCLDHKHLNDAEFETVCGLHKYDVRYGKYESNPYDHFHSCSCFAKLCGFSDDDDVSVHSSISQRDVASQTIGDAIVPYRSFDGGRIGFSSDQSTVTEIAVNHGTITVVDGATMSVDVNYGVINVIGNGMVNIDANYGTVTAVSIRRVNIHLNRGQIQIHQ